MVSPLTFLILFSFINSLFLINPSSVSAKHGPLCHAHEISALLQFKESFIINKTASMDPLAYAKTESWKLINGGDYGCCSWDGITCDVHTGNVIGLELSSSFLYGSINSTSSLFNLVHLRILNLADNHFKYSQLLPQFFHFQALTSLNLSTSSLSGQIPSNVSQLSKLSQLDLSMNGQLFLNNPDFGTFLRNLTSLEVLKLDFVDISSTIPNILANFSSLSYLSLCPCNLYGEFPIGVFQIPRLRTLKLGGNFDLYGRLPEFNSSSLLEGLYIGQTSFSGKLPDSIGNLRFLNALSIGLSDISGQVPSSLANITRLVRLDLRSYNLEGQTYSSLSWLPKMSRLRVLGLSRIVFTNGITPHFANLTQLQYLFLQMNFINTQIPSWLVNMTQLQQLHLNSNHLQGPIPDSIIQLQNLQFLNLAFNNLSGTVEFSKFLNLKKLTGLHLTGNYLSLLLDNINSNATVPKFTILGLGSCNLIHFPNFLRDQDQLELLDLSDNFIQGQIPKWVWNSSKDTLHAVYLSDNLLTDFEQETAFFSSTKLLSLDLTDNVLQRSLPIPPPSLLFYGVAGNNLSGQISPKICSLDALYALDLSRNNFNGNLPPCLGNFSKSLQYLDLGGNNFQGRIPTSFTKECRVKMLFLDSNKLQGELPRSLGNCIKLEFLIIGNNQIKDTFPSWLGKLQELKVLILRSNQFYGVVGAHVSYGDFSSLQIVDISHNYFSGKLPTQYLLIWNKMKGVGEDQLKYVTAPFSFQLASGSWSMNIPYLVSVTNKGVLLKYQQILESFVAIDFSSNKFEGDIPNTLGSLNGLRMLNLSNNNLTGGIPSSLGNLPKLESLDLSRNNLYGEIPQQLTQLTFLAVFKVSDNHLAGPIPQGKQFNTFQNDSFENNAGLCGNPLSRKCGNSEEPPTPSKAEGDKESDSPFEFGWEPVLIGYGSGLTVGIVIGHIVIKTKYEWFLKLFRVRQPRRRRRRAVHP